MDKKRLASALKFDPSSDLAPQLIAKGKGLIAENIIELAKEHDVPVYEDEKLSNQLMQLSLGSEIPTELYEVVAEVLAFIAYVDGRNDSGK